MTHALQYLNQVPLAGLMLTVTFMTSSSALVAIRSAADSNEPEISYGAAYAVASVLATLAGQIVVLLV